MSMASFEGLLAGIGRPNGRHRRPYALFECPCIDTLQLYPLSSLASQALSWNRHRDLHGMHGIGGKIGFLYG